MGKMSINHIFIQVCYVYRQRRNNEYLVAKRARDIRMVEKTRDAGQHSGSPVYNFFRTECKNGVTGAQSPLTSSSVSVSIASNDEWNDWDNWDNWDTEQSIYANAQDCIENIYENVRDIGEAESCSSGETLKPEDPVVIHLHMPKEM
jgi:hypothetical protein